MTMNTTDQILFACMDKNFFRARLAFHGAAPNEFAVALYRTYLFFGIVTTTTAQQIATIRIQR